ncbi:hypothetical protein H9X96_08950 [Pedobacter sp. N36a]|uniref:hypothetical protein n=1 Tax=Pedobacter sp. N36a TaxID=2767996 RepID=UPI0016575943|nr:hypothetical protein [Pedobacter sp. N36a]MBC8985904.1 hypothetical protein [Pedobacter sp. N36a]
MLLSEHKDLKLEIKSLPEKEKDKLLLRLIAKDKILTEHLHFLLMEGEQDLVDRQEQLSARIDEEIEELMSNRRRNAKEALLKMRKLNGSITHHFKVTKDLNSEIELRIHLFKGIPIDFNEGVFSTLHKFNEKLMIYFAKSVFSVYNKYLKMHEETQFDLKPSFNEVLAKLYQHKTAPVAEELGLPKEI